MRYLYKFPGVKGIQSNTPFYICMVPLKVLSRLFTNEDQIILPEYRAQRKLNISRIPSIKNYILENRNSYVFSALAASISGEFSFSPIDDTDLGFLEVDFSATFLINDGQHRKQAIIEALIDDPSLGNETIPIVLFSDQGLKRSQQMFVDLNKHAVKTSKSLNTLYDSHDQIALITNEIVDSVPFFQKYTDKENDNLGKYSKNIFTLNNIYNANIALFSNIKISASYTAKAIYFWKTIAANIIEWNNMEQGMLTKKSLREDYIVTQGVLLVAFGMLGNYLLTHPELNISILEKLSEVNWMRANPFWQGKVIIDGRVVKATKNIYLTYYSLKEILNIPLLEDEKISLDQTRKNGVII